MSMNSKVNLALQQAILTMLQKRSFPASNSTIQFVVGYSFSPVYSLRAIQEATQKMTKAGLIIKSGKGYMPAPVSLSAPAQAATASS